MKLQCFLPWGRGAEFGQVDSAAVDLWNISPDGKGIAYVPKEEGGEVKPIFSNGKSTAPIHLGGQLVQALAWGADQNSIYVSGVWDNDFCIVQASPDGKARTLLRAPVNQKWILLRDVSPDGHYLTYSERTYEMNVNLLEDF